MKYTYLLINIFTISIPLLRSFEARLKFSSRWRYFFPAMLYTALFFLVWDYFKTKYGVWSFNDTYIIGIRFFGLPLEEYLFFFTVPYACTFIYDSLTLVSSKQVFPNAIKPIFSVAGFAMLAASFFFLHKAYTFSVLLGMGLLMPAALQVLNAPRLSRFLLMYLISLVPMFVVNGLLTWLPVVIYNNTQNLGIRAGTIPVEDFLYSAIMLLMNITLYEWYMKRAGVVFPAGQ